MIQWLRRLILSGRQSESIPLQPSAVDPSSDIDTSSYRHPYSYEIDAVLAAEHEERHFGIDDDFDVTSRDGYGICELDEVNRNIWEDQ